MCPAITLVTFYADCVPLYLVDPVQKAIGLSHSGWRGTVAGRMGRETVEAMEARLRHRSRGSGGLHRPQHLQRTAFEVGGEVVEAFCRAFAPEQHPALFRQGVGPGKYQLDLWAANRIILKEAGVPAKQIHTTNICTKCNSDYLFSHRTVGEERGNLAAFLCLKGGAL